MVNDEIKERAQTTAKRVVDYAVTHLHEVLGEAGKHIATAEALNLTCEIQDRLIASRIFESSDFERNDDLVFSARAFVALRGHELLRPELVKDAWLLVAGRITDEGWLELTAIPGMYGELSAWSLFGKGSDDLPLIDLEAQLAQVHRMNLAGIDPTKAAADVFREQEVSAEVERLQQAELDKAHKAEVTRLAQERLAETLGLSSTPPGVPNEYARPNTKRSEAIRQILEASAEALDIEGIVAALKDRGLAASRPSVVTDLRPMAFELTTETVARGKKIYSFKRA